MQREIYGSKNYASFGVKWFDELNQGETIQFQAYPNAGHEIFTDANHNRIFSGRLIQKC